MSRFGLVLRACACICGAVALLHLGLGLRADRLLDPTLHAWLIDTPSLDSQNRFYGTAFGLYAVLLWWGAADTRRHASMLRIVFVVFFAGGLARALSIALVGWPSTAIVGLMLIEVLVPPLLWVGLGHRQPG